MNMSSIFIKRPVGTTLLMMGMLIFGLFGYRALPVNDMPNIELPYIVIFATIPGTDPETMATSVAKPLESQLLSIAGIKNISASNSQGSTLVFIEFEMDRDIDNAALDVQAAINIAYRRMPDTMTSPPAFFKLNPDSLPIISIALTSDSMTLQQLTEYAETYLSQELSMISGVAQTRVSGAKRYAVRIQINPTRMAAVNIGVDDIVNAVGTSNIILPTGVLQGENRLRNIKVDGQLKNAEEFSNIIIAWRNGAPVRLKDVADVIDDVENRDQKAWIYDKEGVVVQIIRQPGGNTVEMVEAVFKKLPSIEANMPPSINMEVVKDNSLFIKASVDEVVFTLWLTVFLVVFVMFLFLRDFTATFIPSLALPFSIVSTFAVMYAMGLSLNNVSLMALILVVGLVVDDAIVMLENIVRHRDMGKSSFDAAMDGSKEIGFTIISMTLSLCAVFVPLLFMPGMVGKIFYEFAMVMIIALAISGLVSVSLTPMLCNKFLRDQRHNNQSGIYGILESGFNAMLSFYEKTLKIAVRHKFIVLLSSFAIIALIGVLGSTIQKGFFPDMDGSSIIVTTRAEEAISVEAIAKAQQSLHPILLEDPAIKTFISVIASGSFNSNSNTGSIDIVLKSPEERGHIDDVIDRLRVSLNINPDLQVFVSNGTQTGGPQGAAAYSYILVGTSLDDLYNTAILAESALKQMNVIRDVSTDLELKNPIIEFKVNRDLATSLGISLMQIENTLYSAFGQRQVSVIYGDISDHPVIMEVQPELNKDNSVFSKLNLKTMDGRLIPLQALVTMSQKAGPLTVNHLGQFPSVTLSFNLAEGQSINEVMPLVDAELSKVVPNTVSYKPHGQALDYQESMAGMVMLIGAAILLIYLILGVLYESFIHPITILSGLPSAAVGAMISLTIFGQILDMMGFVGIIMLIGIVKKNGIMMLDFALAEQREKGTDPEVAIVQGCLVRFRPIMMTTMAAIGGALPLALGIGSTGADMRIPLGIVVAGGLIFSQVVTLYVTPVYYIYFERIGQFIKRMAIKTNLANKD